MLDSGLVFVANGGGNTVSVFDARDGRLRGTWRVVDGPGAMVGEARTDHVFVSSNDVSDGSPNYYIPDCRRSLFAQIDCTTRSFAYEARLLRRVCFA